MKLYKLTDKNLKAFNGFDWAPFLERKEAAPRLVGGELCSDGVYHAYTSPLVAILINPIHADFRHPRMLEVGGKICINDGMKVGCPTLRPLREIPIPEITKEQRVKFGIFCALSVYKNKRFITWAKDWLSGKDRTKESAYAADYAAASAAYAATYEAASAAFAAASAATYAAAFAVGDCATYEAAFAVGDCAAYAVKATEGINLARLARRACSK